MLVAVPSSGPVAGQAPFEAFQPQASVPQSGSEPVVVVLQPAGGTPPSGVHIPASGPVAGSQPIAVTVPSFTPGVLPPVVLSEPGAGDPPVIMPVSTVPAAGTLPLAGSPPQLVSFPSSGPVSGTGKPVAATFRAGAPKGGMPPFSLFIPVVSPVRSVVPISVLVGPQIEFLLAPSVSIPVSGSPPTFRPAVSMNLAPSWLPSGLRGPGTFCTMGCVAPFVKDAVGPVTVYRPMIQPVVAPDSTAPFGGGRLWPGAGASEWGAVVASHRRSV